MAGYRKKPIEVEAEQFDASADHKAWPAGVYGARRGKAIWCYRIDTLEGCMTVRDGDWIITGIKGEKYPCKPDIFAATYELVE